MPRAKKLPPPPALPFSAELFAAGGADASGFGREGAKPFFAVHCLELKTMGPRGERGRESPTILPALSTTYAAVVVVCWPAQADEDYPAGFAPNAFRFRQSKMVFAHPLARPENLGLQATASSGDYELDRMRFDGWAVANGGPAPRGVWLRPCVCVTEKPTRAQAMDLALNLSAITPQGHESTPFVLLASELDTPLARELAEVSRFGRSNLRPDAENFLASIPKRLKALCEARALSAAVGDAATSGAENEALSALNTESPETRRARRV